MNQKSSLLSRFVLKKFSNAEQSALNIVAAVLVVIVNTAINFFLSPFITETLGVEANGYVTIANNFVSYFGLITSAMNSMSGRFMLIEIRRKNMEEANQYYTSVLFGNWFLSAILLVPSLVIVIKLESFINVNHDMIGDIRLLFVLVFLSYFISLCVPKWTNVTYICNRLYLRSLKTAILAILRAAIIFFCYRYLPPFAFYVALAGTVVSIVGSIIEYYYKSTLIPDLTVDRKYYRFEKVKILISSGIWNSISSCGNILLEGLDVLVANLMINPVMSGVLALSKIIPNMINQIVGTIGTTFGPHLTAMFADGDYDGMVKEIKNHIKIVSSIANLLIGGTVALGTQFFALWVPSQNANQLTVLAILTLIGMLFSGMSNCVINIFGVVNKLRLNSLVVIGSGLLSVLCTFLVLKFTDLGVYAIAGVSSVVTILRIFVFTAPYAAACVNHSPFVFFPALLKGALNVVIPLGIGFLCRMIPGSGWFFLLARCAVVGVITIAIDFFVVLNSQERKKFLARFRKKTAK